MSENQLVEIWGEWSVI